MPHAPLKLSTALSENRAVERAAVRSARARTAAWLVLGSAFVIVPNSLATGEPIAQGPAPIVRSATYAIQRYEITEGPALAPSIIERATAQGTGPTITLSQIRRALLSLQQAYRDQGQRQIALQLPRQPLVDGIVRVRAIDATSVPSPSPALPSSPTSPTGAASAPATAPTYAVQHFEVRGNSVLTAEELDALLSPAAGSAVTLEELQRAVTQLQAAYRERGYAGAAVALPQQLLTGGVVIVAVNEGLSPEARLAGQRLAPSAPSTNASPAIPTFEVRHFEVSGNTLLQPEIVDGAFTNAIGPAVSLPQIQKALGQLQLAYRERGFTTVSVGLPQQQLTNAVVKVQVTEGVLTDLQVVGNRHFSSNNVLRALPSLKTNAILNGLVFQRELDLANQNRDRTIYPAVGPGPEPGTSALTLRVKDRRPWHGRVEVNNQATPGTPEWRVNSSAQFNNLWQHEHQVGVSYGFSPEKFKADGVVPDYLFNRPLIANYGAYYRMPLGRPSAVESQVLSSARFGFDEATRQFRLPPASARPELSMFASASSSDTGVQRGPAQLVSQTPLLTIVSQDTGQNLTVNESAGTRLSLPWALTDTNRWSFSGGVDWKRYQLRSFNTNNFLITTVVTNAQGSQTIESVVASPQPSRTVEVQYLPLVLAADYSQTDRWGTFSASGGVSGNWLGEDADFAAAAYSTNAQASFGKVTLAVTRDQRLPADWSLLLRASGQWATGALIANEQFSLGGLSSVRGYYEGQVFGDTGWFTSAELRTPSLTTPVPVGATSVPVWLRASVFMDYGQVYALDTPPNGAGSMGLWGVGFGVSANVNQRFDLRVSLGWPLLDAPARPAGNPRAYFSVGGQF